MFTLVINKIIIQKSSKNHEEHGYDLDVDLLIIVY